MEPFKIACVTCHARLTVRDESAIGQILACPKCGSMVQVPAPPNATQSPAAAPAMKARLTATRGAEAVKRQAPRQPDARQAKPTPATITSTPAAVSVVTRQPGVMAAAAGASTAPAVVATPAFDDAAEMVAAEGDRPADEPLERAAEAPGGGMPAWQFGAIALGASAIGSVLVAGAMTLFGKSAPRPTAQPTATSVETTVSTAPNPRDATAADSASKPGKVGPNEATVANGEEGDPSQTDVEPPLPTADQPEQTEDSSIVNSEVGDSESIATAPPARPKPEAAEPAERAESAPTEPVAPASIAGAQGRREPKLRIDPLDVDPEGLDLSLLLRGPAQDPLAASEFANQPPAPSADSPPPVPQPGPDNPIRLAAGDPVQREAEQPGEATGDRSDLLARRAPQIRIQHMQLVDLIDFATQLSGVPVSVSAAQLRLAGIAATAKASCDAKDATIEQALTLALKPLRLEPVVADGQIVLKRIGDDRPRTVDYAVDDLAATGEEAAKLALEFERLIFTEVDAISVDGRNWHVTALESKQYEALLLLERLRLARGLPPRSKYPASLLSADGHFISLSDRLSAPTTFTFVEFTPLREVFGHWRSELDVPLLVDWPAVAAAHLTPWTRIVAATANKSWAASMDSVLEPMGLGWRAVGSGAIEITTLDRLHADQQIDLYRIGSQANAAAIDGAQSFIRKLANGEDGSNESPQQTEPDIVYDSAHRILIVKQPAYVHRKFTDWLRTGGLLPE